MMIKAVVFDLDNTLYDYDHCNELAEKQLFKCISDNFGISTDEAESLLVTAKKNIKNRLGDGVAASHNRILYMQNLCEQMGKNPLKYARKFYAVYWDTMLDNMKPFGYVKPLFKDLRKDGIKIGILTDLTAYIQYRKIERLDLNDLVDCLVTSEEAGAEKPSEKMFSLMLEKMNINADEVLMVGDSKAKDVDGASNIGMRALLLNKNCNPAEEIWKIVGEE